MSQGPVIDRFINEFYFLSNFYPATVYINGISYPTCEHAYQAHKTLDPFQHEEIRKAKTPAEAKRLGQIVHLRPDWNDIKIDLMRKILRSKFESPFLRELLIATADAQLIEGNFWNDRFWGVCRGVGENWLGRLLMELRDELKHVKEDEDHVTIKT